MWIKISDEQGGIYAREATNPVEIMSLNEINESIKDLSTRVKEVPDQETLDFFNAYNGNSPVLAELQKLKALVSELESL